MEKGKVKVPTSPIQVTLILEHGKTMQSIMVHVIMQMEKNTKENGEMESAKAKVSPLIIRRNFRLP